MKSKSIAVIFPAYNEEENIRSASSVLERTRSPPFENVGLQSGCVNRLCGGNTKLVLPYVSAFPGLQFPRAVCEQQTSSITPDTRYGILVEESAHFRRKSVMRRLRIALDDKKP
jgi:hypothetical protein